MGPGHRGPAVNTSPADASRSGLDGEIEVWTDTDVQMPKKRQQPDNENKIKAAAGITILRLIRGLLQVEPASYGT